MVVLRGVVNVKDNLDVRVKVRFFQIFKIGGYLKTNAPRARYQRELPVSHAAVCVSDALCSTFEIPPRKMVEFDLHPRCGFTARDIENVRADRFHDLLYLAGTACQI